MQHRNWAKGGIFHTWVEMRLTSHIPEKVPSHHCQHWFFFQAKTHLFLYFDFLAPFRVRDTIVAEFPVELTEHEEEKSVCVHIQPLLYRPLCLTVCPEPALHLRLSREELCLHCSTWHRYSQVKSFGLVWKGYLSPQIGFKYFFWLIWWCECCFGLVSIVTRLIAAVFGWKHQRREKVLTVLWASVGTAAETGCESKGSVFPVITGRAASGTAASACISVSTWRRWWG